MKHWVKGESEAAAPELGPGSYWYIAGNVVHADSCLTEICVAFIKYEGPRDGKIVAHRSDLNPGIIHPRLSFIEKFKL